MAFTMHSHSGQFCPGHAVDQLEDIIKHALSIGYTTIALTEHMPRYDEQDLYPEERGDPKTALADLPPRHEAYLIEAQRLQALYASQIHIIIGFEAEFIRPEFEPLVKALAQPACVDFFLGSVHHVHSIPIDYDKATFAAAVAATSTATEEQLFEDYYDLQYAMLMALKPRVVAHFDLIRLLSARPDADPRQWKGVWAKILRNLRCVKEQGGWLECNTAALRKGLQQPYPVKPIAEEWLRMGGKFTMSDDSHGIGHVATNYSRAITFLEDLGCQEVWTFQREPHPGLPAGDNTTTMRATLHDKAVPLSVFRDHFK